MYCRNCGKNIDDSATYCINCGTRFDNVKNFIEKYKEDSINIFAGNKPDAYCLGCTIGTHIGPGAVGVAFFKN